MMETGGFSLTKTKLPVKILVVDDREDNLVSIEAILAEKNYHIVKANSGKAALKILLQEHDFSLILMDVQMPGLNGFETAAIIYDRDKLKNIPVIFITAFRSDEGHAIKSYQMGAVDYIYKPINSDLLRSKVSVFVELYQKNLELQSQEQKLLAVNLSLNREIEERKLSEEKVKQLNQQLSRNNTDLQHANEELDQFAFMASHDLQEPLRKIQMFSDKILITSNQDEETKKYFSKIISSTKRMQSLINNLLDLSRQSMSPSEFKITDLNQVVKDALQDLEIGIEKNDAQIIFEQLPVITAVPELMRQLFANIISNSIKFRKKDKVPVVQISTAPILPDDAVFDLIHEASGNYIKINIADNGIGFDARDKDSIFKVFKRLHSYHDFEGSGVGLAICKKIVEKHSGFITANGAAEQGAVFSIYLPVTQERIK